MKSCKFWEDIFKGANFPQILFKMLQIKLKLKRFFKQQLSRRFRNFSSNRISRKRKSLKIEERISFDSKSRSIVFVNNVIVGCCKLTEIGKGKRLKSKGTKMQRDIHNSTLERLTLLAFYYIFIPMRLIKII